jgi:hypothetical protein
MSQCTGTHVVSRRAFQFTDPGPRLVLLGHLDRPASPSAEECKFVVNLPPSGSGDLSSKDDFIGQGWAVHCPCHVRQPHMFGLQMPVIKLSRVWRGHDIPIRWTDPGKGANSSIASRTKRDCKGFRACMARVTVNADRIFFAMEHTEANNEGNIIRLCVDQYVDRLQFLNSEASSEVLVRSDLQFSTESGTDVSLFPRPFSNARWAL